MNKKILIAAFIIKNGLNDFLDYINETFDVTSNKVFIFEDLKDDSQYIITFYLKLEIGERIDLKKYFRNALIVHKKQKTFYTINALNKVIETDYNLDKGNIDYKDWDVDWGKYENRLIINSKNKLVLIELKRFFC